MKLTIDEISYTTYMLRWFPRFQVATTCFSCSPPDLYVNLLVNQLLIFVYMLNNHYHRVTAQLQLNKYYYIIIVNTWMESYH
jgi:hypothetical protein